ncbi:hypothetical protein niasHT_018381 [Heterodera trifolii]|uniref:Uncharacterized protein n=1 Tax=Heterodera trifolii TaxID=157864 RepID=A0ABD2LDB8_9BILA
MERMNIHRADVLKFDIEQMWTDAGAAKCSWVERNNRIFTSLAICPFNLYAADHKDDEANVHSAWTVCVWPGSAHLYSPVRSGQACRRRTGKCFTPRPDIDMCVVQFLPRLEPLIPTADIVANKVFRTLFHYKRRFLGKAVLLLYPRAVALEMGHYLLKHTGIIDQEEVVVTRLGMDELAALSVCYEKQCRKTPDLFHYDFRHPRTLDVLAEEFSDDPSAKIFVSLSHSLIISHLTAHNFTVFKYIDHSVITFLRSNQQIFNKGANLLPWIPCYYAAADVQPIWDVFVRQIWPIFAPNIRYLGFSYGDHLDNLLRRTSPTMLTDLNINSIGSGRLCPGVIADGASNAKTCAGQALAKWLHTPRKDGHPKRLHCAEGNLEWVKNFKELFVRARTSVSYKINFGICAPILIEPFELVNEWTGEKLTLTNQCSMGSISCWVLKRCPIIGETAAVQWEDDENSDNNLNNVFFELYYDKNCIGPLSPPTAAKAVKRASYYVDK